MKIMKIKKLPTEAISKLQSGIVIRDAVQCVLELVYNALDAKATAIAVRVDLKKYQIQVIDNGVGISKSDLELVGKRFMTSKYDSSCPVNSFASTYGFKGQAISSLLDVCGSLTIKTKSENDNSYIKVFQKNKALPIIESNTEGNMQGTTVVIEDFMYNMPVRRKRISEVFDMEEIKNQMQYLAIIHYRVSFTLRNENKSLILLQTHQCTSTLLSITNIYGASLAKSLKPFKYQDERYQITGFISLKPHSQNHLQLLYINKILVFKSVIHKLIKVLMNKYIEPYAPQSPGEGIILKNIKTASNYVFVVQLICPHTYYELFNNPGKSTVEFRNWEEVLKFVHKVVRRTLKTGDDSLNSSTEKDEANSVEAKKIGTSLLVNAVKGAPAKRMLKTRKVKNKNRKTKESTKSGSIIESDKCKEIVDASKFKNISEMYSIVDCTSDSLESPIPKNYSKPRRKEKEEIKLTPNQSFVQFYEWLKKKFETNVEAYNLYTDFLQYKQRKDNAKECVFKQPQSPVLGRKRKKCIVSSSTKKENERKRTTRHTSQVDTPRPKKKRLQISPERDLRKERNDQILLKDTNESVSRTYCNEIINSGDWRLNLEGRTTNREHVPYPIALRNDNPVMNVPTWQNQLGISPKNDFKKSKNVQLLLRDVNESYSSVSYYKTLCMPNRKLNIDERIGQQIGNSNNWIISHQSASFLVSPCNNRPICQSNLRRQEYDQLERVGKKMLDTRHHLKVRPNVPSPNSSELVFTNLIEFRNLPESYEGQQATHFRKQVYSTESNTWMSHHHDLFTSAAVRPDESRMMSEHLERNGAFENTNFWNYRHNESAELERQFYNNGIPQQNVTNKKGLALFEFDTKRAVSYHDVEIQTNILEVERMRMVDATVQTKTNFRDESLDSTRLSFVEVESNREKETEVKSPFFKFDVTLSRGMIDKFSQLHVTTTQKDTSQEAPYPDFWNTSEALREAESLNNRVTQTEIIFESSAPCTNLEPVDKNTLSSEFVCYGQKSASATNHHNDNSLSKETQTLAAIWSDCLAEIDQPGENSEVGQSQNSKSVSAELPPTIPVEELKSAPEESVFCLSERHDFIPKGLSPKISTLDMPKTFTLSPCKKSKIQLTIDNYDDVLSTVKWQDESTGGTIKPTIQDEIIEEMRQRAEKNMIHHESEILSTSLSYCAIRVHDLLHSFAFTKELLSNVEILGQLDKKFIVARMKVTLPKKMELISLFDQHAVDERIKLEELTNEYLTADGTLISSRLNPELECTLDAPLVQFLSSLKEKLLQFGIGITALDERTVTIQTVPTFLIHKHEKDVKNKKETSLVHTVQNLIETIMGELTETRGAVSKLPKTLHSAFCSEACHSAVKFNRMLTIESMTDMINKLKKCKLPFQCAHGRPSIIPIIDLEDVRSTEPDESITLQKLKDLISTRRRKDFIESSDGSKQK